MARKLPPSQRSSYVPHRGELPTFRGLGSITRATSPEAMRSIEGAASGMAIRAKGMARRDTYGSICKTDGPSVFLLMDNRVRSSPVFYYFYLNELATVAPELGPGLTDCVHGFLKLAQQGKMLPQFAPVVSPDPLIN